VAKDEIPQGRVTDIQYARKLYLINILTYKPLLPAYLYADFTISRSLKKHVFDAFLTSS